MKRLLITIRYDGYNYHGWQVQNNAVTVQEIVQNAIEKVFQKRLDVIGCSRTDSGVHANMYCFSVDTDMNISCENVIMALNTFLPNDVAAYDCRKVNLDFHPRYNCVSKKYVYKIYNGKYRNPFYDRYAFWYKYDLDVEYLNKEIQAFLGTHDYSGFCSIKSDVEDTNRTIYNCSVKRENELVIFEVEGDGFLYNMVRIMVGTMLFIAQGKIKEGELTSIINSCDRKKAGKTAPPNGLYLDNVNYNGDKNG